MAERTLILGTGTLARSLVAEMRSRDAAQVIGIISEGRMADVTGIECPVLGTLEDMSQVITSHRPEKIVVALAEQRGCLLADRLVETQVHQHVTVETGVAAYERLTGKLAIESLKPSNVLFTAEFSPSKQAIRFARAFSLVTACAGALLCLPLMALVALAVRLDSPGPVLFVQERVGLGGKRFKLLKFRTMHGTADVHTEWARDNKSRITRSGKWLRKFRLDELPQFMNVLRGDMNIIGPRPHPISNRDLFILVSRNTPQCGEQIPYYSLRSSIRPGITGWAQVRYKYANGLDEEMEKLRYDLYYIKHYSFLLDLRILLETVKVVLLGHESTDDKAQAKTAAVDHPEGVDQESETLVPGLAMALRTRNTDKRGMHVTMDQ